MSLRVKGLSLLGWLAAAGYDTGKVQEVRGYMVDAWRAGEDPETSAASARTAYVLEMEDEPPSAVRGRAELEEFVVLNEFSPDEARAVRELAVGAEHRSGGGAAPSWVLRRAV